MAKGAKYLANSYIILNNGQKFYLQDSVSSIENKIDSRRTRVKFTIASWLSNSTVYLNPKDITCFGSV